MLKVIKDDLRKNYYDPSFRGMDLDARFQAADEKLREATSLGHVFGIIAQALLDLNDSHTFFIPPPRNLRTEYGFQMKMIGGTCYIIAVKPGSDAETKGLKPGDEVYSLEGFQPTRENLWKLAYLYYTLRPRPGLRLALRGSAGSQKQVDVLARVRQERQVLDLTGPDIGDIIREAEDEGHLRRHRYQEFGDDLLIWKMPAFDLDADSVDRVMKRARKFKALILDLRGNSGGAESTLLRLVGHFFDHDVRVGDVKSRKEVKPLVARTRGEHAFRGKLVVLVDSQSASAAELFARVVQLEHRGTVLGDHTAGAVMRAKFYQHEMGQAQITFYGALITEADVIMADGQSLEKRGVAPDEVILPSPADLAAKRDPVLSRAAALVGVIIDAQEAGALFPIEWRK